MMPSDKTFSFKFCLTLLTVSNTAGASKHSCSLPLYSYVHILVLLHIGASYILILN